MVYKNKYREQSETNKGIYHYYKNKNKDAWIKYFIELYDPQQTRACSIPDNIKINVQVNNEEVLIVIKALKTASHLELKIQYNKTNDEYSGGKLYSEIVKLLKSIFIKSQTPEQWESSILLPVIKKVIKWT